MVSVDAYYLDALGTEHQAGSYRPQLPGRRPQCRPPVTRTAVYTPASGQRYYWTEGEDFLTTTSDTYSASAWLGLSAFYSPQNIVSSSTWVTNGVHLTSGGYIETPSAGSPEIGTDFYMSAQESVTSQTEQQGNLKADSTWYGKTTYSQTNTDKTGTEDTFLMSIKADDPINIAFTGSDAGKRQHKFQGQCHRQQRHQNANGNTSITAGGQIEQESAQATIGGQNVSLICRDGHRRERGPECRPHESNRFS